MEDTAMRTAAAKARELNLRWRRGDWHAAAVARGTEETMRAAGVVVTLVEGLPEDPARPYRLPCPEAEWPNDYAHMKRAPTAWGPADPCERLVGRRDYHHACALKQAEASMRREPCRYGAGSKLSASLTLRRVTRTSAAREA